MSADHNSRRMSVDRLVRNFHAIMTPKARANVATTSVTRKVVSVARTYEGVLKKLVKFCRPNVGSETEVQNSDKKGQTKRMARRKVTGARSASPTARGSSCLFRTVRRPARLARFVTFSLNPTPPASSASASTPPGDFLRSNPHRSA